MADTDKVLESLNKDKVKFILIREALCKKLVRNDLMQ